MVQQILWQVLLWQIHRTAGHVYRPGEEEDSSPYFAPTFHESVEVSKHYIRLGHHKALCWVPEECKSKTTHLLRNTCLVRDRHTINYKEGKNDARAIKTPECCVCVFV